MIEKAEAAVAANDWPEETNGKPEKDPLFVRSLEKAFKVLQAFRGAGAPLGLSEIALATGLGKSAVQRFCHTLVALGYLEKDERTRRLRPSVRLLDFSFMYLQSEALVQIASPLLLKAREDGGEAVNLALPMDTDVMYVVRLPSLGARLTSPLVGGRAPMFCTASGRAILSTLADSEAEAVLDRSTLSPLTPMTITDRTAIRDKIAEVRREGFTIANQECIVGEVSVASPIIGKDRQTIGAVNICTTTPAWSLDAVRHRLAPIVHQTALEISRVMGLSPFA